MYAGAAGGAARVVDGIGIGIGIVVMVGNFVGESNGLLGIPISSCKLPKVSPSSKTLTPPPLPAPPAPSSAVQKASKSTSGSAAVPVLLASSSSVNTASAPTGESGTRAGPGEPPLLWLAAWLAWLAWLSCSWTAAVTISMLDGVHDDAAAAAAAAVACAAAGALLLLLLWSLK